MSTEYNSILITKLFAIKEKGDEDNAIEILEEIKEIKDPIFLYPVYEKYKENRDTTFSHYFISTIDSITSNDVVEIAYEIGETHDTSVADLTYVLDIFKKRNIYNQRAIDIANKALELFMDKSHYNDYNLNDITNFFKNAKKLKEIEDNLFHIFSHEEFNPKSRGFSFGKWLEVSPKINIQYIIDNYSDIKKNKIEENVIAKVISTWNGPKSEELKSKIENEGNIQAKHIILRVKEKEKKKPKTKAW